jgi:hypothetical protein
MARQTNPKLLADFFNKIGPFLPFQPDHGMSVIGGSTDLERTCVEGGS